MDERAPICDVPDDQAVLCRLPAEKATARRDQAGNPASAIGPGTASEGAEETATSRPHSWRAPAREGSASPVPRGAIAAGAVKPTAASATSWT